MPASAETPMIERLARERRTYEQMVTRRFGGALSAQDAEDIVSDALIDSAAGCPPGARDGGRPWFTRVVLNRAEDFRRARDGRPRSARGAGGRGAGVARRFVALDELGDLIELADPAATVHESLEHAAWREDVRATVERALDALPEHQATLIRLRYLSHGGDGATRSEVAERMGISVWQYESMHTAARKGFANALAGAVQSPHCARARTAMRDEPESSHARRFADAHASACCSCRAARKLEGDVIGRPSRR